MLWLHGIVVSFVALQYRLSRDPTVSNPVLFHIRDGQVQTINPFAATNLVEFPLR